MPTLRQASADEAPLVQPPRAQPQPKAVVHQHLHAVRSLVHEQVRVVHTRLTEHAHHARERRIHPGTHVQRFEREPDRIDPDHFTRPLSHSEHSRAAEAGHSTITALAPRRTSMRIRASLETGGFSNALARTAALQSVVSVMPWVARSSAEPR